ncbi:hypothetical protein [Nostoc sp.]|uniref:hypothetical protein n=1 Tax=Nostoc sp. TaxID=1180 RepID=UPI002FF94D85
MKLARLKAFRQAAYKHLGKARDATFELTDAVLLTRNAYSLANFSLSPVFRRKWPSIYLYFRLDYKQIFRFLIGLLVIESDRT